MFQEFVERSVVARTLFCRCAENLPPHPQSTIVKHSTCSFRYYLCKHELCLVVAVITCRNGRHGNWAIWGLCDRAMKLHGSLHGFVFVCESEIVIVTAMDIKYTGRD